MKKVKNPQTFTDHLNNSMVDKYLDEKAAQPVREGMPENAEGFTKGELPEKFRINHGQTFQNITGGSWTGMIELDEPTDTDISQVVAMVKGKTKDHLNYRLSEICKRYNSFPGMLEALKMALEYRKMTHHGDDKLLNKLEAILTIIK